MPPWFFFEKSALITKADFCVREGFILTKGNRQGNYL